ncbi:MAG: hypothetical protein D5S00_07720 [Tindallia sp. MSAO_Bac2]|nr:MAG: hypothetical protein D5S00_07720 [Tindallia sp. MSAO_Bac2]
MGDGKENLTRAFRWFYGILGASALVASYIFMMNGIHHDYGPLKAAGSVLRLFTNQSNLLVVTWAFYAIFKKGKPDERAWFPVSLRGALGLYIGMTFLIYHFFLRGAYSVSGPNLAVNIITHYAIPFAYLLDWLLTESPGIYRWKHIGYWMIYPAVYALTGITVGVISGNFPYSFLGWHHQGMEYLVIYGAAALIIFLMVSAGLVYFNKTRYIKANGSRLP